MSPEARLQMCQTNSVDAREFLEKGKSEDRNQNAKEIGFVMGAAIADRDWLLGELKRKVMLANRADEKWNDLRRAITEFEDMFDGEPRLKGVDKYPAWLQVLRKKVGPR